MEGPSDRADPPPHPIGHGVRVWHLAAVVLVVALLLGGLIALRKEASRSGVGGALAVSSVVGVFAITCFGSARIGAWLTRRPLDRLKRWGVWRGGVVGFLAWLFPPVADAALMAGSVTLGLAAAFGLLWMVLVE